MALIEGIESLYNCDIFGICETYLTSLIPDDNLILNGFGLAPLRADCKNAGNCPRGGVCLYYKEHLPLRHLEFVDESIVVEIDLNREKVLLLLLYRSPSQTPTEFASFMEQLSMFYNKAAPENHTSIVLTGDFNAHSPVLWENEIKSTPDGKALSDFAVLNGFEQIIDEPTHLPRDDIETGIDLILTNKRFSFIDSGVIP